MPTDNIRGHCTVVCVWMENKNMFIEVFLPHEVVEVTSIAIYVLAAKLIIVQWQKVLYRWSRWVIGRFRRGARGNRSASTNVDGGEGEIIGDADRSVFFLFFELSP
jgi:hypothetical protein